ncbi:MULTISPECIES: hypothetical protein [unclassified Rhizobium]|uniref:hypothetical protein n=1 Tax=unclassified Rhizobium TaxID=2613769 RepID=UPI0013C50181|nr:MULTISPECIES: hypothetical protein [unclassified Rhizobium]
MEKPTGVAPSASAVEEAPLRAVPGKVRSGFPSGMRENKSIERFRDPKKGERL